MRKPYLLITGIPRSGTTLVASLIDRLENTVCLNEPPQYYEWASRCQNRTEFVAKLMADLKQMRVCLQTGGTVFDTRERDGSVPTNYFNDKGQRRKLDYTPVSRQSCGENLLLAVKHNEPLTAMLPELCRLDTVQVVAIVRHPIPTILSWQSRNIPLSKGNLSPGYRFWNEAIAIRDAGGPVARTQARIFELYCSRYWEYRDRIHVIKYEDIVLHPSALEQLTGKRFTGESALATQNRKLSSQVGDEHVTELKRVMSDNFDKAYHFYPDLEVW